MGVTLAAKPLHDQGDGVTGKRGPKPALTATAALFAALRLPGAALVQGGHVAGIRAEPVVQASARGEGHFWRWPVPGELDVTPLLKALERTADDPDTPDEDRDRLRKARASLGEVSRSVLAQVVAAMLKQAGGIGP